MIEQDKVEQKMDDNVMADDYIKTINDMKANTVSKEEYEAMREENRKLLQTIVTNENTKPIEKPKEVVNLDELRTSLFNGENNNLQYAEKALKLRKALLEQGKEDCFVPQGSRISATEEDYKLAQKVADALDYCIEYAQGDSEVFTNELQRITKDVKINKR